MKKNGHHHHHNTHIFDLHHGIWSFILYLSLLIASHFLHFSLADNFQGQPNCWSQRANLSQNDFVLECTDDGHFKPVQCDNKTGYCFCVDPYNGRPNTQTTTKNRQLDCNHHNHQHVEQQNQLHNRNHQLQWKQSSYNSMRQPSHTDSYRFSLKEPTSSFLPMAAAHSQLMASKQKRGRPKRCSTGQRISYINQMVTKIQQSMIQQQQQQWQNAARLPLGIHRPRSTRPPSNSIEFNPIIRKFNDFDRDKDHSLSADELKLMINEIYLSPTESNHRSQLVGCADSMFEFCDRNHDLNVTRPEFIHCLNLQHTQALNELYLQRRRQQRRGDNRSKPDSTVFNYDNLSADNDPTTPSLTYGGQGSSIPLLMENAGAVSNQSGSDRSGKRKESRKDCNLIRANFIESARVNPHGFVFIPECTPDGYYVRVQCHLMHCWCVSRVTGQPIKALNKNSTENLEACDLMRKGCDQRRRVKFHQQFRQRLSSHGFTCDSIFDQINSGQDKSDSIAENEFKSFIRQWSHRLSINSRLKKCLRTEIHYCDQNDDGRLAKNEWVQCCNDNITVTNMLLSPSSSLLSTDRSMNHHQFNAGRRDSGLYPRSNFFSTEFAEVYNQKKNRPRHGQNPLKILNSE
ncbi:SPARC related modular calcium binding-like protein magu isoform X2 [Dermatophagoides farinae]|uniref:SPARC- modular calcium-binding protein 1 n=1 Tax=Dermatophagoides farinae TaxID=6954 RepID=A0A922LCN4_DERFA|nr:uncharacterized protein LOC124495830 isoform X2 [Dermatophagoides farinae]KAH9526750.1 SPARC- modular calcium-binding protein 1 [Dermatophagoides farinae]